VQEVTQARRQFARPQTVLFLTHRRPGEWICQHDLRAADRVARNGSRECVPDDRFREASISPREGRMDCFVASAFALELRRTGRLICPSGGLLKGVSSFISDFPKNILVPTPPNHI
jgi:hypothetical protein